MPKNYNQKILPCADVAISPLFPPQLLQVLELLSLYSTKMLKFHKNLTPKGFLTVPCSYIAILDIQYDYLFPATKGLSI